MLLREGLSAYTLWTHTKTLWRLVQYEDIGCERGMCTSCLCSQNCKKVSWAFIIAALKSSIITLNMWCKQVKIFHTRYSSVRTSPHSSSIVALRAKHDIFTQLWCVLFKFASSFLELKELQWSMTVDFLLLALRPSIAFYYFSHSELYVPSLISC